MKFLAFHLFIFILLGCYFDQEASMKIQAKITNPFSTSINNMFILADTINAYLLQPFPRSPNLEKNQRISDFKILKTVPNISQRQKTELLKIITDSTTYHIDGVFKKCYFTADVAFEFIKKEKNTTDTVTFLISDRCKECKVLFKGKTYREDIDDALPKINRYLNKLFQKE